MKKHWKWIALLLALCVACGAWFYYETERNLSQLLPEETWSGVKLSTYDSTVMDETLPLDAVLSAINATKVDRGQAFHAIPAPFYVIWLETPDGPPTIIYVLEDGRISIAWAMDTDHYQYYENGGELYTALLELMAP